MGFVFKWEMKRGKSKYVYTSIREEIKDAWLNENRLNK